MKNAAVNTKKSADEIAALQEENKRLREKLKTVSIQATSDEYLAECGDELDGQTAIEAWDSLIIDVRQALAKGEV
jgi:flagellin-like hook-associated protein FlgL